MAMIRKTLDGNDWDKDFRGWRCPEVKTHSLNEVRVSGAGANLEDFQARGDVGLIAWRGAAEQPESIVVVLVSGGSDADKRSGLSPLLTALIGGVFGILAAGTAPWWTKFFSSASDDAVADPRGSTPLTGSGTMPTTGTPSVLPPVQCPAGAKCDRHGYLLKFSKTLSIPKFTSGTTRQILDLDGFRPGATLSAMVGLTITQPPEASQRISLGFLHKSRFLGEKTFARQECTETACTFAGELTATTVSGSATVHLTLDRCQSLAGPSDCNVQGTLVVVDTDPSP